MQGFAGDRHEVVMVRKEQHLRLGREFSQNLEPRRRALVIEVDEEVVGEEREFAAAGDAFFDGGQAQRQEKLIAFARRLLFEARIGWLVRPSARKLWQSSQGGLP